MGNTELTRRHFNFVAGVLRTLKPDARARATEAFALAFPATNRYFNREKFLRLCGYKCGEVTTRDGTTYWLRLSRQL
jgi:hypothetical protein